MWSFWMNRYTPRTTAADGTGKANETVVNEGIRHVGEFTGLSEPEIQDWRVDGVNQPTIPMGRWGLVSWDGNNQS